MKLVTIESPYATRGGYTVRDNVEFARRICRWAVLERDAAPYASHLFYTQPNILSDNSLEERSLGIAAGLLWSAKSDEVWFCLRIDESPSPGMLVALDQHRYLGVPILKLVFDLAPFKLLYEEELQ